MANIFSAVTGALGVGSSLLSSAADIAFGVKNLQLQQQQLEVNKQALEQNKQLSQQNMMLTAAMPFIEQKANLLATKNQMQARYDFFKNNGADAVSLLAIGQGKTVFSSGASRIATVHNTSNSMLAGHTSRGANTPIFLDSTPRKKTITTSTQAGNPFVGTQPGKSTQTPGSNSTSIGVETQTTANVSTQVGFPFVFNNKTNGPVFPVRPVSTNASTQTNTRTRQEQAAAVREIAFTGVGLNNARKVFYRDTLIKEKKD